MGVLSKAWRCLESKWPQATQIRKLHQELLQLLCLGPLLQGDLTSEYDGQVTCSDASESGGAAAISRGLSWSGQLVGFLTPVFMVFPAPCCLFHFSMA